MAFDLKLATGVLETNAYVARLIAAVAFSILEVVREPTPSQPRPRTTHAKPPKPEPPTPHDPTFAYDMFIVHADGNAAQAAEVHGHLTVRDDIRVFLDAEDSSWAIAAPSSCRVPAHMAYLSHEQRRGTAWHEPHWPRRKRAPGTKTHNGPREKNNVTMSRWASILASS